MFVAPIHDFRAVDVAHPAPARKMPEPEITHGHMGHDPAIGTIGGPADGHGRRRGGGEGGEGERDQAVAKGAAHGGVPRQSQWPDNGEAGSEFPQSMRWPGPPPVAVPAQPGQSEGTSTAVLEMGARMDTR